MKEQVRFGTKCGHSISKSKSTAGIELSTTMPLSTVGAAVEVCFDATARLGSTAMAESTVIPLSLVPTAGSIPIIGSTEVERGSVARSRTLKGIARLGLCSCINPLTIPGKARLRVKVNQESRCPGPR